MDKKGGFKKRSYNRKNMPRKLLSTKVSDLIRAEELRKSALRRNGQALPTLLYTESPLLVPQSLPVRGNHGKNTGERFGRGFAPPKQHGGLPVSFQRTTATATAVSGTQPILVDHQASQTNMAEFVAQNSGVACSSSSGYQSTSRANLGFPGERIGDSNFLQGARSLNAGVAANSGLINDDWPQSPELILGAVDDNDGEASATTTQAQGNATQSFKLGYSIPTGKGLVYPVLFAPISSGGRLDLQKIAPIVAFCYSENDEASLNPSVAPNNHVSSDQVRLLEVNEAHLQMAQMLQNNANIQQQQGSVEVLNSTSNLGRPQPGPTIGNNANSPINNLVVTNSENSLDSLNVPIQRRDINNIDEIGQRNQEQIGLRSHSNRALGDILDVPIDFRINLGGGQENAISSSSDLMKSVLYCFLNNYNEAHTQGVPAEPCIIQSVRCYEGHGSVFLAWSNSSVNGDVLTHSVSILIDSPVGDAAQDGNREAQALFLKVYEGSDCRCLFSKELMDMAKKCHNPTPGPFLSQYCVFFMINSTNSVGKGPSRYHGVYLTPNEKKICDCRGVSNTQANSALI